jgi:hypothetical protein
MSNRSKYDSSESGSNRFCQRCGAPINVPGNSLTVMNGKVTSMQEKIKDARTWEVFYLVFAIVVGGAGVFVFGSWGYAIGAFGIISSLIYGRNKEKLIKQLESL